MAQAGRHHAGHGTDCLSDPCPPQGACCLPDDGGCIVATETTCLAKSGSYVGDDTNCTKDPCAPTCPADLNSDGIVNAADLAILLGAWGPNPGSIADLDPNGAVDAADLATLLGAWGPC